MPRVLLLVPATSYRAEAFLHAAARLTLDVTVGSNHRQVLAQFTPGRSVHVDFGDLKTALPSILSHCRDYPVVAVIGTDDETTTLAARVGSVLNLPHNTAAAVSKARNKFEFRRVLVRARLNCPTFERIELAIDPATVAAAVHYPCVLKPLDLSGSRGVIRADNEADFIAAFHRVSEIITGCAGADSDNALLVETFIEGVEVSLEGVVHAGSLRVLALFDKPDLLNGPYFEETIYVTPSRLSPTQQCAIVTETQAAVAALGLTTGPIHAELRLDGDHAYVLEIAPRTIGGHCSRALRFPANVSLEELVLRQAIGASHLMEAAGGPSGVMMIPIPRAGRLARVTGVSEAIAVPGITDVKITIPLGDTLTPLPEGDRYLGFIFAEASSADSVECALRIAHSRLEFEIHSSA